MNTPTHVLLAVAVLGSPGLSTALTASSRNLGSSCLGSSVEGSSASRSAMAVIILGALLPDLSLYLMFVYAVMTGVPQQVIWTEMYYSDFWQTLGAMTNSLPLFLLGGVLCLQASVNNRFSRFCHWGFLLCGAALLHVLTDLPLHHDDGHPHFWPFTQWIYSSPVSYWDANHYANFWVPFECALGAGLLWVIWQRVRRSSVRAVLLLTSLSYVALATFFLGRFFMSFETS